MSKKAFDRVTLLDLHAFAREGARQTVQDIADVFPELHIRIGDPAAEPARQDADTGRAARRRKKHWTHTAKGRAILAARKKAAKNKK